MDCPRAYIMLFVQLALSVGASETAPFLLLTMLLLVIFTTHVGIALVYSAEGGRRRDMPRGVWPGEAENDILSNL